MRTLESRLNESIKEFDIDNVDSLTEEIKMLYIDYFTEDNTDSFDIETKHVGNIINRQITFLNNLKNFNSFKEAVNSIINDFNKKMIAKGQKEITYTWEKNNEVNILELSQ